MKTALKISKLITLTLLLTSFIMLLTSNTKGFINVRAQDSSNSAELVELHYLLLDGWNFVSFPVETIAFETAADLIRDVVDNGGFVSTVATWEGDNWATFTHSAPDQFGSDFAIEPGKAYFIRSHEEYDWKVYGVDYEVLPTRELTKGWNAVSLVGFKDQTAENILDSLSKGEDIAREIDWWQSGSWDPFVKRIYSTENIETYGNNFHVDDTKGYMINTTQPTTLENKHE